MSSTIAALGMSTQNPSAVSADMSSSGIESEVARGPTIESEGMAMSVQSDSNMKDFESHADPSSNSSATETATEKQDPPDDIDMQSFSNDAPRPSTASAGDRAVIDLTDEGEGNTDVLARARQQRRLFRLKENCGYEIEEPTLPVSIISNQYHCMRRISALSQVGASRGRLRSASYDSARGVCL